MIKLDTIRKKIRKKLPVVRHIGDIWPKWCHLTQQVFISLSGEFPVWSVSEQEDPLCDQFQNRRTGVNLYPAKSANRMANCMYPCSPCICQVTLLSTQNNSFLSHFFFLRHNPLQSLLHAWWQSTPDTDENATDTQEWERCFCRLPSSILLHEKHSYERLGFTDNKDAPKQQNFSNCHNHRS